MADLTYEQEMEKELAAARERAAAGVAASRLMEEPEGKLIQDWLNKRVSLLLDSMTAAAPLSHSDYLAAHGGARELKDFNAMLHSTIRVGAQAGEEARILDEQRKAISGE